MLTRGISPVSRDGVHLFIPSTAIGSVPSLSQVAQLRADGVHCRESSGTRPVVLKVVPVTGAAFSGFTKDQIVMRISFITPFKHYWYVVDMSDIVQEGHSAGSGRCRWSEGLNAFRFCNKQGADVLVCISTMQIRRYFQHAHFIPVVFVGKRGAY